MSTPRREFLIGTLATSLIGKIASSSPMLAEALTGNRPITGVRVEKELDSRQPGRYMDCGVGRRRQSLHAIGRYRGIPRSMPLQYRIQPTQWQRPDAVHRDTVNPMSDYGKNSQLGPITATGNPLAAFGWTEQSTGRLRAITTEMTAAIRTNARLRRMQASSRARILARRGLARLSRITTPPCSPGRALLLLISFSTDMDMPRLPKTMPVKHLRNLQQWVLGLRRRPGAGARCAIQNRQFEWAGLGVLHRRRRHEARRLVAPDERFEADP